MTWLRPRIWTEQLYRQLGIERDPKFAGDLANCLPTAARIRTEGLAFDEGDPLMAKLLQMFESQVRSLPMVKLNTDGMLIVPMSRHRNHRHRNLFAHLGIHSDDAIHGPRNHEAWISLQQLGMMTVTGDKVEQALLEQGIFNTTQNGSRIPFTYFRNQNADCERAFLA